MNPIFRSRLTQATLWIGLSALATLLRQKFPGSDAALALLIAVGLTAMLKLALLVVFRSRPANLADRLSTLGGLLASLYGQDK